MNWLINSLIKEARRFNPNDDVRYFVHSRKGTGKGIVLTPSFRRGKVVDYDTALRRYRVKDEDDEEILVHPRNLVPGSISKSVSGKPDIIDNAINAIEPEPTMPNFETSNVGMI